MNRRVRVKLKPCPFCGGEAVEYQEFRFSVVCTVCGAFGPDHDGLTPDIKMENCTDAWNRRTPEGGEVVFPSPAQPEKREAGINKGVANEETI